MGFYVISGPPTSPEKFHYTERTKSSITLAWKPPRNDGGSPIIGYIIEKKRQDHPAFQPVSKDLCTDLTLTVENLDELHMYEFRAKAVNSIAESDPSIPVTAVIQDDEGLSSHLFAIIPNKTFYLFFVRYLTVFYVLHIFTVAPTLHMMQHFKFDLVRVRKNEPVEIPAEIIGLPLPKVEWLKDEVVIAKPTERVLFETKVIDRQTEHTKLTIPATTRLEKGTYTVTASNRLGTASHSITVEVLGKFR